jgi:hypothetical protein
MAKMGRRTVWFDYQNLNIHVMIDTPINQICTTIAPSMWQCLGIVPWMAFPAYYRSLGYMTQSCFPESFDIENLEPDLGACSQVRVRTPT